MLKRFFSGEPDEVVLVSGDNQYEDSRKYLKPIDLFCIIFLLVCGGPYGIEYLIDVPPLYCLLGVLFCPWVFGLPLALITAELTTSMPYQEGFLHWSTKAFGPLVGYVEGWLVVLIVMIDKALYPIIFLSYLSSILSDEFTYWQRFGINSLFVIVCFLLITLGARIIGRVAQFITLIIMVQTLIFVITCFSVGNPQPKNWIDTNNGEQGFRVYINLLIWLYSGYDYSGFLADETKDPSRTYPKTLILSLFINTIVYLLPLMAALSITVDPEYYYEGSFSVIANLLGIGPWVSYIVVTGALFSNIGVYIVYLHTSSNALCALAIRGDAPAIFSRRLQSTNSPVVAVFFYSITTILWTLFDFVFILEVETVLYCIHAIILILTFFKLRYSFPDMERPYLIPGPIYLLVIYAIFPIAIAIYNITQTHLFELVLAFLLFFFVISSFYMKGYFQSLMANYQYKALK